MAAPEFVGRLDRDGVGARAKLRRIDDDELVHASVAPQVVQAGRSAQHELVILAQRGVRAEAEGEGVIVRRQAEGQIGRTAIAVLEHDGVLPFPERFDEGARAELTEFTGPHDFVRLGSTQSTEERLSVGQFWASRLDQFEVEHEGIRLLVRVTVCVRVLPQLVTMAAEYVPDPNPEICCPEAVNPLGPTQVAV